MGNIKIQINNKQIDNNLLLYMFWKSITKIKLTANQLEKVHEQINEIDLTKKNTIIKQIEHIFKDENIIGRSKIRNEEIENLLTIINDDTEVEKIFWLLKISFDII